jgi:hypothetical protein
MHNIGVNVNIAGYAEHGRFVKMLAWTSRKGRVSKRLTTSRHWPTPRPTDRLPRLVLQIACLVDMLGHRPSGRRGDIGKTCLVFQPAKRPEREAEYFVHLVALVLEPSKCGKAVSSFLDAGSSPYQIVDFYTVPTTYLCRSREPERTAARRFRRLRSSPFPLGMPDSRKPFGNTPLKSHGINNAYHVPPKDPYPGCEIGAPSQPQPGQVPRQRLHSGSRPWLPNQASRHLAGQCLQCARARPPADPQCPAPSAPVGQQPPSELSPQCRASARNGNETCKSRTAAW